MAFFETERLRLRNWKESDLSTFQAMNKDPRVMAYFPNMLSDSETISLYNRIKDEFKEYGYGLYAAETKENSEFIGFIGFHWATFESDFTPCIEIGWRLKFDAWGKGFATEGAKACLKYGFDTLNFDKVYSFTSKINTRSQNVMKKIGMQKVTDFDHPNIDDSSELKPHVLYEIARADWSSRTLTDH